MSIISERTKDNVEAHSGAEIVPLKIKRADNTHYLITEAGEPAYPTSFLMHEDEFGDMFGGMQGLINKKLSERGEAQILVLLEVL